MKNLLLITGAGASYDVTNTPQAKLKYKPPLARDIFNLYFESKDGHCIADCLNNNSLAHQAGTVFYNRLQAGQEENLESYLTNLKNSGQLPRLRQGVPGRSSGRVPRVPGEFRSSGDTLHNSELSMMSPEFPYV